MLIHKPVSELDPPTKGFYIFPLRFYNFAEAIIPTIDLSFKLGCSLATVIGTQVHSVVVY